jgi:putative salt-induced outer membrane protein YdiY
MVIRRLPFLLLCLGLGLSWPAGLLRADVVETRAGARLVGKIAKIEEGKVLLETDYAGKLEVKQSEVTGIATEEIVAVRLQSGATLQGRLTRSVEGGLAVSGVAGETGIRVDQIAATWPATGEDPAVIAMRKAAADKRRHWALQIGADITGRSGNASSSGVATNIVAAFVGPQDALKLYGDYNYMRTDNSKSTDEAKAGVEYTNFFHDKLGWFSRSELQRDEIAQVDLRATSDVGLTYRFIKNPREELAGRIGAGYRYENFTATKSREGVILAFGLSHSYKFNRAAVLTTELKYLPNAADFADFRFVHDSGLEVPMAASLWKMRMGVTNQYDGRPQPGREHLDTTYYTRLLLNWK